MPAYLVGNIHVHDPDEYARYAAQVPDTIAAHGGRYLARGGEAHEIEGDWGPGRVVVSEFPDMAALRGWYESPEYQAILPIRHASSTGDLVFVEGV